MAEPLILASVSIDESGVVQGAQNANAAVDSMESNMEGATKGGRSFEDQLNRLGEHMFSLSSITRVLAHTMGLYAAVHLAITAIEDTDAFKNLKEAAADLWAEFVKGESTTDRLNSHLAGISKQFGLHDISEGSARVHEIDDEIAKLNAEIAKLQTHNSWFTLIHGAQATSDKIDGLRRTVKELNDEATKLQQKGGLGFDPYALFGGKPPAEISESIGHLILAHKTLEEELKSHTITAGFHEKALIKLHDAYIALGMSEEQAAKAGFKADIFKTLGIPSPNELSESIQAVAKAQDKLYNFFHTGQIGSITFEHGMSEAIKKLRELGLTSQQIRDLGIHPMAFDLIDLAGKFDTTTASIGFMKMGMDAAGAAIGDFVSGNKVNLAQALHDTLASVAKEASTKAIFELAAGFAASAVYDAKAASAHFTAAAFYGEVAAVAGIGARLGGTSQSSGGSRGASAVNPRGSSPTDQGGRVTNLIVNVQGHVIGNEQWLRGAIVQIQRSIGDGTGGGGSQF